MLQSLLRHEAWVHASHHHRHALDAEPVSDLISAVDVTRHCGNSHQIGLQIEVDRLNVLVGENHLVLVFRDTGGNGQQARSGEYSARLKYIGRVVSESVFGLIRWMMRVRTKTSFCPKTGFLLAEPPTRVGSDQADSNLLWARSFRIGTPGSLGRIPNADPPRWPEGRAGTSLAARHKLRPGERRSTTPMMLLWPNQTAVDYFNIPAKIFAKVWASPGHRAET